ncbi:MAG: hypothetical protein FWF38_00460 [Spirochaetaceae bacterium]|nr:hypothetical protein [Spirochaetaceae bacterium]
MPRVALIDQHKDKAKIIKAIISGEPYRNITQRYGLSKFAITRYLQNRLIQAAAKAQVKGTQKDGENVNTSILEVMSKVEKLYTACDRWLRDPTNREEYTVEPRATEVDVVYTAYVGDKPITKKDSLQNLLDKAMGRKDELRLVYTRMSDVRKIIVDTAAVLTKQLEVIARIKGAIPDVKVDITISQAWLEIKQTVLEATKGYPEVRERLLNGIRKSNIE